MPKAPASFVVRIKPAKGKAPRRFTYGGIRFDESRGWYRVDASVAEYLRDVKVSHERDESGLLFEVCTQAEAEAIDKRETAARMRDGKAEAKKPIASTANSKEPVETRDGAKTRRGGEGPLPELRGTGDLNDDDLKHGTSRAKSTKTGGRSMRAAAADEV